MKPNVKKYTVQPISVQDAVRYEIYSNWLTPYLSWGWAQQIGGKYFAWKAKHKHKRYIKTLTRASETLKKAANGTV